MPPPTVHSLSVYSLPHSPKPFRGRRGGITGSWGWRRRWWRITAPSWQVRAWRSCCSTSRWCWYIDDLTERLRREIERYEVELPHGVGCLEQVLAEQVEAISKLRFRGSHEMGERLVVALPPDLAESRRLPHVRPTAGPTAVASFPHLFLLGPWLGGTEIHYRATIVPGLIVLHPGLGTVISAYTQAGQRLSLAGGNAIGGRHPLVTGDLVLGDRVSPRANALILGPVRVGADVRIGAGAVVVRVGTGEADRDARGGDAAGGAHPWGEDWQNGYLTVSGVVYDGIRNTRGALRERGELPLTGERAHLSRHATCKRTCRCDSCPARIAGNAAWTTDRPFSSRRRRCVLRRE
jgi:hypothetical protein